MCVHDFGRLFFLFCSMWCVSFTQDWCSDGWELCDVLWGLWSVDCVWNFHLFHVHATCLSNCLITAFDPCLAHILTHLSHSRSWSFLGYYCLLFFIVDNGFPPTNMQHMICSMSRHRVTSVLSLYLDNMSSVSWSSVLFILIKCYFHPNMMSLMSWHHVTQNLQFQIYCIVLCVVYCLHWFTCFSLVASFCVLFTSFDCFTCSSRFCIVVREFFIVPRRFMRIII